MKGLAKVSSVYFLNLLAISIFSQEHPGFSILELPKNSIPGSFKCPIYTFLKKSYTFKIMGSKKIAKFLFSLPVAFH